VGPIFLGGEVKKETFANSTMGGPVYFTVSSRRNRREVGCWQGMSSPSTGHGKELGGESVIPFDDVLFLATEKFGGGEPVEGSNE